MNGSGNHFNVLNKYDPSFLADSRMVLKAFLQAAGKEGDLPFKHLYLISHEDNPSQLNDLPAAVVRVVNPYQLDRLASQTRDRQFRVAILPGSEQRMVKDRWERVIERVMALETEDFDISQLKWVILMVLFNEPGAEAAYAWMEDLVFESLPGGYLH